MDNFVNIALNSGGKFKPLLIPPSYMDGPSLTNPSVLTVGNRILVNIRNVNYTLYHAENNRFEHRWGPLSYIHPEHDLRLRTTNYLCLLDDNLDISSYSKVNTSLLDKEPLWEFVGLEDARLIVWDNKMYLCGVRRDTTTTGVGRMELSELRIESEFLTEGKLDTVHEISRFRIPAPNEVEYCNKNWMPLKSEPFTFVKWSNPVEVVKADPKTQTCSSILQKKDILSDQKDWRGSSQVLSTDEHYVCIVHETDLYKSEAGNKDATYRHRFLVWDKNWNLVRKSRVFSFLDSKIEFCCGMDVYGDSVLITFGLEDNAAYIVSMPISRVEEFIYE